MGAWIETRVRDKEQCHTCVAPFMGAWIETSQGSSPENAPVSHPSWVRGLKRCLHPVLMQENKVAPFMGAWIETYNGLAECYWECVAPFMGAWIETLLVTLENTAPLSHPSWVRGLKLLGIGVVDACRGVAPFMGAWIETSLMAAMSASWQSHPSWVRGLKLRKTHPGRL